MSKTRIILDTDIGDDIDDAIALLLALRSPELEVMGITTVYKNTKARSKIVKEILKLENRLDIPVYYGCGKPIIDQVDTSEVPCQMTDESTPGGPGAVKFIINSIMTSYEPVTMVTVGPMTNLALAILNEPKLKNKLKRIVMMAGSFYMHSNECNIVCDPEAARIVFDSGIPIEAVGLDVTKSALLSQEQADEFFSNTKPVNKYIIHLLKRWRKILHDNDTFHPSLHDPLAIMSIFDDKVVKYQEEDVFVELQGEYTRGSTFLKNYAWGTKETSHVKVAISHDNEYFTKKLMERIM